MPRRTMPLGIVVAAALFALALPASSFFVLAVITGLAGVPHCPTHNSEEEQPDEDQGQEQDDQERHHKFLCERYYPDDTHDADLLLSRGQGRKSASLKPRVRNVRKNPSQLAARRR